MPMKTHHSKQDNYKETNSIKNARKKLLATTRSRARREEIECLIALKDIIIPETCPATKIAIDLNTKAPLAEEKPVIDRLDLNKGYLKSNIFITSMKAYKNRVIGSSKCSHCGKKLETTRNHQKHITRDSKRFCSIKCNRDFHNQANRPSSGNQSTHSYKPEQIPDFLITRQEAAKQGMAFYRTNKPCKRGHQSAQRVNNGSCLECEQEDRHKKTDMQNQRYHGNRKEINQRRNQALRDNRRRRAIKNLRSRRSTLFKQAIDDMLQGISKNSFDDDLGCSQDEFLNYVETTFQPGMKWENYGLGSGKWNLDHIKPISFFKNPLDPKAWHSSNYQALSSEDNIKKGGTNNPIQKAVYKLILNEDE